MVMDDDVSRGPSETGVVRLETLKQSLLPFDTFDSLTISSEPNLSHLFGTRQTNLVLGVIFGAH